MSPLASKHAALFVHALEAREESRPVLLEMGESMFTAVRSFLLLLLASAFCTATLSAQQSGPAAQPAPAAQTAPAAQATSSRRITLDVVAAPQKGTPVAGLQQQDFQLFDNKSQQPITSFQAFAGKDTPVKIILLIDAVNTSYQSIAYERGQIDSLLRANGGHLAHPMALAIFTDTGSRLQPAFSTDGNALSQALDQEAISLRTIRRSAGFYGAAERFDLSLRALGQIIARQQAVADRQTRPERTLLLWVSPGWPLLSSPNVQMSRREQTQLFAQIVSLSDQMRKARITLYSVNPLGTEESTFRTFYYQAFLKGVRKPNQVSAGNLGLQVLAVQSGGLALASNNDVTALLRKCLADADAYYEISFEPAHPERPDEYHTLEVRVNKPGVVARTRTGYYAQP